MVIFSLGAGDKEACRILADKTGLPVVTTQPDQYFLAFEDDILVVKDPRQGRNFKLAADVQKEITKSVEQKNNYKKDLLSRAVGYKGVAGYTIFDGTFGFGRDSFHLLALGCTIIGCEANPVAYGMLASEISQLDSPIPRLELIHGDTYTELPAYAEATDCLYLDPMFENAKKKSAPKKHMAFLREIAVSTTDVSLVIERAIKLGVKRVVVKRPINGDHLYETPQNTLEGKLVRYDVYIR